MRECVSVMGAGLTAQQHRIWSDESALRWLRATAGASIEMHVVFSQLNKRMRRLYQMGADDEPEYDEEGASASIWSRLTAQTSGASCSTCAASLSSEIGVGRRRRSTPSRIVERPLRSSITRVAVRSAAASRLCPGAVRVPSSEPA